MLKLSLDSWPNRVDDYWEFELQISKDERDKLYMCSHVTALIYNLQGDTGTSRLVVVVVAGIATAAEIRSHTG